MSTFEAAGTRSNRPGPGTLNTWGKDGFGYQAHASTKPKESERQDPRRAASGFRREPFADERMRGPRQWHEFCPTSHDSNHAFKPEFWKRRARQQGFPIFAGQKYGHSYRKCYGGNFEQPAIYCFRSLLSLFADCWVNGKSVRIFFWKRQRCSQRKAYTKD